MSRRITRSQSRSRSRSMSASVQDSNIKSKPSKRPKKKSKLDPVAEVTNDSKMSDAQGQKTSFESRVGTFKMVINANGSLQDSSDAAVDVVFESLLKACNQLKKDMQAESGTWTDDDIKLHFPNIEMKDLAELVPLTWDSY